jgi:hypothetical protein
VPLLALAANIFLACGLMLRLTNLAAIGHEIILMGIPAVGASRDDVLRKLNERGSVGRQLSSFQFRHSAAQFKHSAAESRFARIHSQNSSSRAGRVEILPGRRASILDANWLIEFCQTVRQLSENSRRSFVAFCAKYSRTRKKST